MKILFVNCNTVPCNAKIGIEVMRFNRNSIQTIIRLFTDIDVVCNKIPPGSFILLFKEIYWFHGRLLKFLLRNILFLRTFSALFYCEMDSNKENVSQIQDTRRKKANRNYSAWCKKIQKNRWNLCASVLKCDSTIFIRITCDLWKRFICPSNWIFDVVFMRTIWHQVDLAYDKILRKDCIGFVINVSSHWAQIAFISLEKALTSKSIVHHRVHCVRFKFLTMIDASQ